MLGALKAHHKEQISPEESLKEVQGDGPADLATDTCRFKRLGKGAGGAVYLACYLPSLQLIAIKEVVMHHVEDQHMVAHELHALHDNLVPLVQAATHKSIKFLGKLSHRKLHIGIAHPCPQIVSFYGAFATPNKTSVSIAMEYMDCGTLQTFIDKKIVLPEAILQHIAYCTTQALAHMHRHRMLHRDIKPANILVDHNGEFKIADFGLASTLSKSASYSSEFQGTMMYMSPERIQGNEYSYPSDIWSIGVTLLTLSLGAYPFDNQDGFFGLEDAIVNEPIPGAPTTFSAACQAFIATLLVKDPSTRLTAEEALAHEFLKDYSRTPAYDAVWATVSPQTPMRPEDIRALVHAIRRHEASLSKTRDDAFDFQSHDLASSSVSPSSWSLKHVANLAATCATSVETLLAFFQEPLPDEANPVDI
ncbi:STE/STE7/MEK1 protein kinase [Saprolegnia parasitica CBS 223.65]|uniref:mitogen-activated protein kinase kinase n=1 Tax=Saprolegnia parasitica (strain CBS 223.65) TaxID=695850 RepID=A0A067BLE5_SAPPC|nr:STE/STE7/MEK1 protein kinase [Saprolegnia parasitica CBS 223.65]KDO19294.1 STE/STE7/MEK1 protein kinase [Saprolegnia parasitica CBS 223.65]|eukprot:XP_012210005.1 STE/STE7/MEK1 protein kinase [Saprolegnia parasitica CBS 223.65]